MKVLQNLLEKTLDQIPRFALQRCLAEKVSEAGLSIDEATLSSIAQRILSGSRRPFTFGTVGDDVVIRLTNEDIERVVTATERFHREQA